MAATIAVYVYRDDMDDKVLQSMGVRGGVLGQLSTNVDLERERELLESTEKLRVGSTEYKFVRELSNIINGLTQVDNVFLQTLDATIEEYAGETEGRYDIEEIRTWFEEHAGDKVFVQAL